MSLNSINNNNNEREQKPTIIKIILTVIVMAAAIFTSLLAYFYFTPNYLLLKYAPIVVSGALGYILNKRYGAVALEGVAAITAFIIPPYLVSPFYILPQVFNLVEVMILLSCGYFIVSSVVGIVSGKMRSACYITGIVSLVLVCTLLITGFIPLAANRMIADDYIRRNYPSGSYKHVSTEFNPFMDKYNSVYKDDSGGTIAISTNSVEVMYDSKKGNG